MLDFAGLVADLDAAIAKEDERIHGAIREARAGGTQLGDKYWHDKAALMERRRVALIALRAQQEISG